MTSFRSNTRARETQAEIYVEEIISIADSSSEESGAVAKASLQVDARKWYASKVASKKYGDRIQQDINANVNISLIDRVLKARKRARGDDGEGTS